MHFNWREYHEATKHSPQSIRRSRHFLDWANLPNPFRHYEGVPVIDLPSDPPAPPIATLDVLAGQSGARASEDWLEFLSALLFYSASISAAKQTAEGYRYALRVNPSSGNLHPTEFHIACPNGLYHYRVSSHMLEQRAAGDYGPLRFLLATIAWREAWKYQSRAYRYCLLDLGHAWQALALSARAIGCDACATGNFNADDYRLAEDEWPMLEVEIRGAPEFPRATKREWYGGIANKLSDEVIRYPLIDAIHSAALPNEPASLRAATGRERHHHSPSFGTIARQRRSALDFEAGSRSISQKQLETLLHLAADPTIDLYLYVHRVNGLAPGLYRYWPETAQLELLKPGDRRVIAAALSLGQDLAGNSCVTFSMIGDLDRGYRNAHIEAGSIGQRLYLAAEALGFQSTGIGAFYDDDVHEYLGLPRHGSRQVVYHFACGYAVTDDRLVAKDRELLELD